jgi:hypothetical protein
MKLTDRRFLIAVTAVALIATSVGFGIAESTSSAKQADAVPASAESFVYFPSQYTLTAPNAVSEHIQAF